MNPQQYQPYGQQPGPQPSGPPPGGYPPQPGYPGQPQPGPGYGPSPGYMPPGYPTTPPGAYQGPQMPPAGAPGYGPQQAHTSGYNPNPYPGEFETKKPLQFRKIVTVVASLVMVLLLVAVVLKIVDDSRHINVTDDKSKANPGTTSNADNGGTGDDLENRSDGKLGLSTRTDGKSGLKEQSLQAKVNQQINLSSGFSFMVTEVKDYTPADTTVKPAEGKKFISVSVVAGNRTNSRDIDMSYVDFKLRNAKNELLTGDNATLKALNNQLASPTTVKPGMQINGIIVFQVDAAAVEWALVHTETYQKVTDGSSFNVQGSIVLQLAPNAGTPAATSGN